MNGMRDYIALIIGAFASCVSSCASRSVRSCRRPTFVLMARVNSVEFSSGSWSLVNFLLHMPTSLISPEASNLQQERGTTGAGSFGNPWCQAEV